MEDPRYHMWRRLLWPNSTKEERLMYAQGMGFSLVSEIKPSEEDCERAMEYVADLAPGAINYVSFGNLPAQVCNTGCCVNTSPIKEDNMYRENFNEREQQIDRLNERLSDACSEKYQELRGAFYIDWTDVPKTVGEIRERLANGQIGVNDNGYKDTQRVLDAADLSYWLTWRTKDPDREGFDAVIETLNLARRDTEDQFLLDYPAGLAALKAFEGTTFH